MARPVMSLMLAVAAVVALCRCTAFVPTPQEVPRAAVVVPAAMAPMLMVSPAFAETPQMDTDWMTPDYNKEEASSDLTYLLFFTAALLVYVGKTAFDKSGAKSLGDAVSK
mmetsp:Transcript_15749/g.27176  ORF Transcript_15749/g.27176 Transcript_15749/m.27176 type:complete len:110 (+) Transcript_15749:66-395(+)